MNVSMNLCNNTTKLTSAVAVKSSASTTYSGTKSVVNDQDQLILSSGASTEAESTYGITTISQSLSDEGTTFPEFNPVTELAKKAKVVKEHYSKVNEENKRFADPEKHIWRKYNDRQYEHYVGGLTDLEREICYKQEIDVYRGKEPRVCSYDPVIQENFGGWNIFLDDINYNTEVRTQMNDSINQIFEENGIIIPDGADLRLTVDPYDYKIHASGVDEELAEKIEQALNKGKNGYNLYTHLEYCNPANLGAPEPEQYASGGSYKATVHHIVKAFTGYDLRDLETDNGKFLTPDGQDVWELVEEKYAEICEKEGADAFGSFSPDAYDGLYRMYAFQGWDNSYDRNLTIGYKDGELYDVDTEYGYGTGQTGWLDQIKDRIEEQRRQYRAEREETIRYEESQPNKLDLFRRDSIQVIPSGTAKTPEELLREEQRMEMGFGSQGLIGIDGKFYPAQVREDLLESLTRSFQIAELALSQTMLRFPGTDSTSVARRSLNVRV